jgi:hypothetical protein
MGFVNEEALFDAEVIGQIEDLQRLTADPLPLGPGEWQGHTAQGSHANDDYEGTFEVDEVDITTTTPEKKHFKVDEVDSPDVIPLTQFLTKTPENDEVDRENDDVDLLDSSSSDEDSVAYNKRWDDHYKAVGVHRCHWGYDKETCYLHLHPPTDVGSLVVATILHTTNVE